MFTPRSLALLLIVGSLIAVPVDAVTAQSTPTVQPITSTRLATPISIVHPIRLERWVPQDQVSGLPVPIPRPEEEDQVSGLPIPIPRPEQETTIRERRGQEPHLDPRTGRTPEVTLIYACELMRLEGHSLTVRVHYNIAPEWKGIVYAGAWLFAPGGLDVGSGYRPQAIRATRTGHVDVLVSLPEEEITTEYLEVFLIQEGHVFARERFSAPYLWNHNVQ